MKRFIRRRASSSVAVVGLLLILPLVLFIVWTSFRAIEFNRECGGHLKRAADANTVPLALKELQVATAFLESNKMTDGYTSVVYETPDEDVGFWYKNLKDSEAELVKASENKNLSQLEASNVLMKLRETLTDHSKEGQSVTEPDGISKFPNNVGYAVFGWLSAVVAFIGCVMVKLGAD